MNINIGDVVRAFRHDYYRVVEVIPWNQQTFLRCKLICYADGNVPEDNEMYEINAYYCEKIDMQFIEEQYDKILTVAKQRLYALKSFMSEV